MGAVHGTLRIEAAVFDLDGTLLDTLADLASSMNRALATMGFPEHPRDAYRYFVGDGVGMLVRRVLPEPRRDPDTEAALKQAFVAEYAQGWNTETRPYPGILPLLTELRRRGIRMAIFSNKPDAFTQQCVEHLLPPGMFDVVLGQREGLPRKPDPAGLAHILGRIPVPACAAVLIGDTATDMDTARAAGVGAIGVTWGFRPESELRAHGAHAIVHEPGELAPLLGNGLPGVPKPLP